MFPTLRSLLALPLALALVIAPATAPADEAQERGEELRRQLDEAWQEMMDEMAPVFEGFSRLFDTLGQVDSLEHYEAPVILDNGDILLKRKPDAPPLELDEGGEEPPATGGGIRT